MVQNMTMDGQEVVGSTIDSEQLLRKGGGVLRFHMTAVGEPSSSSNSNSMEEEEEAKLQSIHNTPTSILQSRQDLQLVDSSSSYSSSSSSVESLNKTVMTLRKQLHYYKTLLAAAGSSAKL